MSAAAPASDSGGSSIPTSSARSDSRFASPPEFVTMWARRPILVRPAPKISPMVVSSSRSAHRIAPACRSAAAPTRALPASFPEWATIPAWAADDRPTLHTASGLPASARARAATRKPFGSPNPSTNARTASVRSSEAKKARYSASPVPASEPHETIVDSGTRPPLLTNASTIAPLWATTPTRPRRTCIGTVPIYGAAPVTRSTKPMQLVPTTAIPRSEASVLSSAASSSAAGPESV